MRRTGNEGTAIGLPSSPCNLPMSGRQIPCGRADGCDAPAWTHAALAALSIAASKRRLGKSGVAVLRGAGSYPPRRLLDSTPALARVARIPHPRLWRVAATRHERVATG